MYTYLFACIHILYVGHNAYIYCMSDTMHTYTVCRTQCILYHLANLIQELPQAINNCLSGVNRCGRWRRRRRPTERVVRMHEQVSTYRYIHTCILAACLSLNILCCGSLAQILHLTGLLLQHSSKLLRNTSKHHTHTHDVALIHK